MAWLDGNEDEEAAGDAHGDEEDDHGLCEDDTDAGIDELDVHGSLLKADRTGRKGKNWWRRLGNGERLGFRGRGLKKGEARGDVASWWPRPHGCTPCA